MANMNVFRILADVSHTISKCILIWAIHSNRSAEGVSLLTQAMYTLVFVARYFDIFWVPPFLSWWNFILKIFYVSSSIYIIGLMTRVYARTREREKAWRLAGYSLGAAIVLTPIVNAAFGGKARLRLFELSWSFSHILESVCVLPQLLLLRQTTVPTVIDSFYLVTLGSYRGLYIFNWIYKAIHKIRPDPVSVTFGVIQTLFYLDFAWVYWTRQRVKLRGGNIIDSEDLRKGWLVNRFIDGRTSNNENDDDDTEARHEVGGIDGVGDSRPRNPTLNRWGARGVSISAEDTLAENDLQSNKTSAANPASKKSDTTSSEQDPFLADDDEDDDDALDIGQLGQEALNSHSEWQRNNTNV